MHSNFILQYEYSMTYLKICLLQTSRLHNLSEDYLNIHNQQNFWNPSLVFKKTILKKTTKHLKFCSVFFTSNKKSTSKSPLEIEKVPLHNNCQTNFCKDATSSVPLTSTVPLSFWAPQLAQGMLRAMYPISLVFTYVHIKWRKKKKRQFYYSTGLLFKSFCFLLTTEKTVDPHHFWKVGYRGLQSWADSHWDGIFSTVTQVTAF